MKLLELDAKTTCKYKGNTVEIRQITEDGEIQKVVLFNFEIEKLKEFISN